MKEITLSKEQIQQYINWLINPEGVYLLFDFATEDEIIRVKLPLVRIKITG